MEVPTAQQLASDRENEAPILERHDHNLEPGDPAATANPSVGNVTTGVLELSSVGIETRDPWELGQWSLLSPSHPPATTWLKHQTVGLTVSSDRLCSLHLLGAAQALPPEIMLDIQWLSKDAQQTPLSRHLDVHQE